MKHHNQNGYQIDLLEKYASKKGGLPLYLLYNFVNLSFDKKEMCEIEFGIEQFGCSIINALYIKQNFPIIKNWKAPTFNDLHPSPALPWFVIPCCFHYKTKKEILEMLSFKDNSPDSLKNYNIDEIRGDKDWKEILQFDNDSNNDDEEDKSKFDSIMSLDFSPKYRIIVSPNPLSKDNKVK
jgi:hypothetical protein